MSLSLLRCERRRWTWIVAACAWVCFSGCASHDRMVVGNDDAGAPESGTDAGLDVAPRDAIVDVGSADLGARDVGTIDTGTDVGARADGLAMCPATCAVDSDCQSACPALPSTEVHCCMGGTCAVLVQTTCGVVPFDAGGPAVCPTTCTASSDCNVAACGILTCCFIGSCVPSFFCPLVVDSGTPATDTGAALPDASDDAPSDADAISDGASASTSG